MLGSIGCIGYGYIKYDDMNKDYKNLSDKYNEVSKKLENESNNANKNARYEFDLSNIECSESNKLSCIKNVDVRYNNENHLIKIESSKQKTKNNEMEITYKIYDNDKLFQTIEGGSYNLDSVPNLDKNNWDFDGFIYVFDSINLGFVLQDYSFEKIGYDATFITSEGKLIKKVNVDMAWTGFGTEDMGELDSISNLEFDGHMLKVWDLDCENFDNGKAIQFGITIDNDKLMFKKINEISGVTGGGQGGCKFKLDY
ncbi:MAG: VWD domain-containing protein [Bacilli bacterium]